MSLFKDNPEEIEDRMVGTFVHEAEHALDPNQVRLAKSGKGDYDSWHSEKLLKLQMDTLEEAKEFRQLRKTFYILYGSGGCLAPFYF